MKLATCQLFVNVFNGAVWIALTGTFSTEVFSAVSFHTSSDIPQHRLCLVPALKVYSLLVQETQVPAPMNMLWSSRQQPPGVQHFCKWWGFFWPLMCCVSPPRKQVKGQHWLLSPKGPEEYKDHTVPGAWCDASSAPGATRLQAASSLGFTWQSHNLIPNTEHSAAHQTRPLKKSHWCKSPAQWLPAFAWNDPIICLKGWCVQLSRSQITRPSAWSHRVPGTQPQWHTWQPCKCQFRFQST